MSINAIIEGVQVLADGTVKLVLGPFNDDAAGQERLIVMNPPSPPSLLRGLIGEHIWGGCGDIMIGETRLAKREGYTRIRLEPRHRG